MRNVINVADIEKKVLNGECTVINIYITRGAVELNRYKLISGERGVEVRYRLLPGNTKWKMQIVTLQRETCDNDPFNAEEASFVSVTKLLGDVITVANKVNIWGYDEMSVQYA